MKRFIGKHVLVTGAANGIGRAAAMRLAEEGACLALIDQAQTALEEVAHSIKQTYGVRVVTGCCDVSDFTAVGDLTAKLVEGLGGALHALSHNAGIMRLYETHKMTLADWDGIIRVNLTGTFCVNRHALPYLLEQPLSYLVNTSSIAEHHPHPWAAAYSASKGGIHSFTRSLFIEYHKRGLRANCIKPGGVLTELAMHYQVPEGADPELLRFLTPFGSPNLAEPEAIAGAIAFLCSDDARFMNGSDLVIDGGKV